MTSRLGSALDFATANHQLLTTPVLRDASLDPTQIAALVTDGVIERLVRGLYRTRGSACPMQDAAAASMRHADAQISHTTALFIHGLDVVAPKKPHLTLVPGRTSHSSLAVLHRSPIAPADRTRRHRIPVTTVARSIVDSAELLSEAELGRVVNEALSRRMVTISRIEQALARVEREPGRVGSGRVRAVLRGWTDELTPDSPAEAAVIRRILDFGLARPVTQHEICDEEGEFVARVDLAWPDAKVLREYDSDRFHSPDRTDDDELRLQHLERLGWAVGTIKKPDLLPSAIGWLRKLAHDLAAPPTA